MTPVENRHNDTKLLLSVAGLVLAGAVGIVMLANWGGGDEDTTSATQPTVATANSARRVPPPPPPPPALPVQAMPASYESVVPETEGDEEVVERQVEFGIDPAEDLVARGLEAWGARDFARSAAYFMAEAQARPERAWTHYMIGLSLWKDGRADEAEAAMEETARLDPDSVRTLVNLARIRNDQADFEGALEAARAGLAIDTEDATALFLEGRSLVNLGRLDEAEDSVTASLKRDPDNGYAQNLLGLILIRQGRGVEALTALERAAELVPRVAYVQNNLGMAQELNGRDALAVLAYRKAVEIDPGRSKASANLARLEPGLSGEPAEVETIADRSVASPEPVVETVKTVEVAVATEDGTP